MPDRPAKHLRGQECLDCGAILPRGEANWQEHLRSCPNKRPLRPCIRCSRDSHEVLCPDCIRWAKAMIDREQRELNRGDEHPRCEDCQSFIFATESIRVGLCVKCRIKREASKEARS